MVTYEMVTQDFYDSDHDLVSEGNRVNKYCPIVEDISIKDEVLYEAVEEVEKE